MNWLLLRRCKTRFQQVSKYYSFNYYEVGETKVLIYALKLQGGPDIFRMVLVT